VAVGDFNGDGVPDLAVADYGGGVSVLLGNGDGSFQAPVSYLVGTASTSVAVADFNGDGIPDLAVVNQSGGVSVLLGNGDGTFGKAVKSGAGYDPYALAVGDFNGDGIPDLAVTNYYYLQGVSILPGNGDGTFARASSINDNAGWHNAVAVGDFNGDGAADLAVTSIASERVSVFLGHGDGTFGPAVSYAVDSYGGSVAVGDFNGDGIADLAVPTYADTVDVLLGRGDGSFQGAASYAVGTNPRSVAVGDFNGDAYPDLAVANYGSDTVSVLLNTADGTGPSSAARSAAPAVSRALVDTMSARYAAQAPAQLAPPATGLQAAPFVQAAEGGQAGAAGAASGRQSLGALRPVPAAAWDAWGDALGEGPALSLPWAVRE
jgi:hypothetical protein